MKRRTFFAGTAGAGLAMPLAQGAQQKSILELTYIRMRNNEHNQSRRSRDFLEKSLKPALKRSGSGPVGLFSNLIGEQSPNLVVLTSYAGLGEMEAAGKKLAADEKFAEDLKAYYALEGLGFQRVEKSLLRGFDSFPAIEIPPTDEKQRARIFEMRIYESNTHQTLQRKMRMFDDGEIDLFRKVGMVPVFFGETIVGQNMPNLTYMVGFDSLADREQVWGKFGSSPEWRKMAALPGLSDAEIVSNISNAILRPLSASDIR